MVSSTRNDFHLIEETLNPMRELLGPNEEFMAPCGYTLMLVIDMFHRHHSWVGTLAVCLLWELTWFILVPLRYSLEMGGSNLTPVRMADIIKTIDRSCWLGSEARKPFVSCW